MSKSMQETGVGSSKNKPDSVSLQELGEDFLKRFCKKASLAFFEQYGLLSHQINSYNDFIQNGIQKVIDSVGEIIVEPDPSMRGDGDWKYVSVRFGKVRIQRPTFWSGDKFTEDRGIEFLDLHPRHARLQKMTYSSRMRVETHVQVYTKKLVRSDEFTTGREQHEDKVLEREDKKDMIIGRIPVMVRSELCWMNEAEKGDCEFDHGGYFIVKGAEKIFIAQEQICLKRLWLSGGKNWMVQYRPVEKSKRVYLKLVDTAVFKDIGGGEKIITVSFLLTEMPVWILFFALGASSDREVVNSIDMDIEDNKIANTLIASIYDADKKCDGFRKGKNALNYIEKLMKNGKFPPTESVEQCIRDLLFPNLQGLKQKALFLGYMVKCLLEAYTGRRKTDNRDDFRNKRLELASELLARELKVLLKHAERSMVKALQKDLNRNRELQPIEHYLNASIVTNGLSRAFSTGSWAHPRKGRVSGGVVADLLRTNPLQTATEMRKTRLQVAYSRRVGDARYPHPSHWGKVCFVSTPDGENCGLVKNLASLGLVSTANMEPLLDKLLACGMKELVDDPSVVFEDQKIFLDGDWVGTCQGPESFVEQLRNMRRRNKIPQQVEIKMDKQHGEVRIFSDAGRILRPLLIVENVRKLRAWKGRNCSFQSLLDSGIIELIGPEEEEDCVTAWDVGYLFNAEKENPPRSYTHCELDMSFLLGLSCGIMPFANHNDVKRVIYESQKHSQQAIGFSTTNPSIRTETNIHQLYYPQMPLFRTVLSECLGKSTYKSHKGMLPRPEFYNGQCAIVAVNVHLGYNVEDSVVMNRASLERGMFRSEHIRSYKAEEDNKESSVKMSKPEHCIIFGKRQKPQKSENRHVDNLDDDGLPYIGAKLDSGDIIIGKYAKSGSDHSVKLKHTEKGMVQKVILSANDDGKNFAVVSLRQVRSPCVGDKFASMHGQKGVVGFLDSQENFPFTREGIVPDIVINPHAFPSRQTPGQLLEAALGKGIAVGGGLKYATPFSALSVDAIGEQLMSHGFSRWGNERVMNGRTGEMMHSLIFMGPTFYQRLTHMAEDKVKFRSTGPVHPHTRQPVASRKRFGGVKFGEMERDSLLAHGASANLLERCFALSDSSEIHICRKCRNMANVIQRPVLGGLKIRGPYCQFCMSTKDIVKAKVPHGAKLLVQELLSMNISLKFDTELC